MNESPQYTRGSLTPSCCLAKGYNRNSSSRGRLGRRHAAALSLKTRGVQPWGVHGHSSRRPRAATLGTEPHPASSFPCAGQALGNPSNWAAALEMIPAAPVTHLPRRSSLSPPAGSNGCLLRCPPGWSAVWFPDPLRGGVHSRVHDVSRIGARGRFGRFT